jgi:hypothetical protein
LFSQWLTDRLGRILAGESVEGVRMIEPEPAKAKKAKGATKAKGSKVARKTASPDPKKDHRGGSLSPTRRLAKRTARLIWAAQTKRARRKIAKGEGRARKPGRPCPHLVA